MLYLNNISNKFSFMLSSAGGARLGNALYTVQILKKKMDLNVLDQSKVPFSKYHLYAFVTI